MDVTPCVLTAGLCMAVAHVLQTVQCLVEASFHAAPELLLLMNSNAIYNI